MLDAQIFAKLFKPVVVELPSIFGDQNSWYAEPTYYGRPHKLSDMFFCNVCQTLGFDLLGEVVDCQYQKCHLPFSKRKGTYDVNSPL